MALDSLSHSVVKTASSPKLYKILPPDNLSPYVDFDYSPYIPAKGKPGRWTPAIVTKTLSMCRRGYHLTAVPQNWLGADDDMLYEAEGKDERVYAEKSDKQVFRQIRLLRLVPRSRWKKAWRNA